MNYRKLLFILLSILFLVSFFSCKKRIEDKTKYGVEGIWKKVDVSNVTSPLYEEWQLLNGVFSVTRCNYNNNQRDLIYTGKYTTSATQFKKTFTITECSYSYFEGDWTIHILKDNHFSFYRSRGGLEYFEFTRL